LPIRKRSSILYQITKIHLSSKKEKKKDEKSIFNFGRVVNRQHGTRRLQ
jgi:hypothetical protein